MPLINCEQEREWARQDAMEEALVAVERRESEWVARVAELEAELAQARHLLRELWDSAALADGAGGDLVSRVFDELNKE